MLYKLIRKKRDLWFRSAACTVGELTDYMMRQGKMRDAQIEAIKTYLFLKISCENNNTLIEIELRDLKEVLDSVVVEDEAEWKVYVTNFHSDRVCRKIEELNKKGQQQATLGKKKSYKHLTISEDGLETIEWISLDSANADKEIPWHSDSEIKIDKLGLCH
jgi:hypothetical protein